MAIMDIKIMLGDLEVNDHAFSLNQFHKSIRAWDAKYRRIYPWRTTDNPFHIMMAELMLRRTQARQVIKIYEDFSAKYPDVYALATAPAEEVARSLFSLGLAWRVPAFQQIARALVEQYEGMVPSSYDALVALPGIGDYVASAVCCFAFYQAIIIVDTNTVRVAGRLFGVPTHAESRRRKPVRALLQALLDTEDPTSYNYAMLDLAALICTPTNPDCPACPLISYCATGQERTTNRLVSENDR
jgi:A/G-specific adenine glycosylase